MGATASRLDPFLSFNFIVNIEGIRAGFSEVGGLMTETDIIEYREGSENITVRKLPGKAKFTNISFKRGYTPNGKELWAWRKTVMDGKTLRKGGTIVLLDEGRSPALTWEFNEAWPSKLGGPALNAKNNDVAIEELEICVEWLTLRT